MSATNEPHAAAPSKLVVDLGMHLGDDSEFYLRKGFRVLAVEAAPQLAGQAAKRLHHYIESGQLTVLNVAVADYEGEVEFFLSEQDLWGSTRADMADRGFGSARSAVSVPCTTLDKILADYPTPHYVKIDVEGRDRDCIAALQKVVPPPQYVSFEADLTDSALTIEMLDKLSRYGYRRFKLVNQAIHHTRSLPYPSREGIYVRADFNKHMSGPFGEESPGEWLTRRAVEERYRAILRQQAARIEYSARGTLFGIPLSGLHRPVMWAYNCGPVAWLRMNYARARRVEPGGWFDIHAGL